jgi:hypothetical protein
MKKSDEVAVHMGKALRALGYDATLHPEEDGWIVRAIMVISGVPFAMAHHLRDRQLEAVDVPVAEIATRYVHAMAHQFVKAASQKVTS